MLAKFSGEGRAHAIGEGCDSDEEGYPPEELADEFADDLCFGGGCLADFIFHSVFELLCIF